MPRFRLLRRARADLIDIAELTAGRWGEGQAERYVTGLYSGFHTLVDWPELRKVFAEAPPYFGRFSVNTPCSTGSSLMARC